MTLLRGCGLAIVLALAACQPSQRGDGPHDEPATRSSSQPLVVRGQATYRERVKMPPGASVRVQLLDNQLADTPQAVLAETTLTNVAGPPFPFSLRVDRARLRSNGQYGVRASLYGPDGKLWFVTDPRVAVDPDSSAPVELMMVRVPGEGEAGEPTAASPWERARARGIGFRAVGNEPGWLVELGIGEAPALHAELDYGEHKLDIARAQPLKDGSGYRGQASDGTAVELRIERQPCRDDMSGESFPARATLKAGERQYRGCGVFLFD